MSDSWKTFNTEVVTIKSLLNNNNFLTKLIEKEANKFISSKVKSVNNKVKDNLNFYFCNRMIEHYNKETESLGYHIQPRAFS